MLIPLTLFTLVISGFLLVAFCFSYLFWSDRYKTPEVIAAEVMQFSEWATSWMAIASVTLLAFAVVFLFSRLV